MIASSWLLSVPAFTLGCVVTEVRWIVRMRRLQAQLGQRETSGENQSEGLSLHTSQDAAAESPATLEDTPQSLRNLSQQLAGQNPVSPFRESLTTLKS